MRLIEKEVKRREKTEEERNNSIVEKKKEGGVRNKLCFVLERASFPSPLLICTICTPRISEPELEQWTLFTIPAIFACAKALMG